MPVFQFAVKARAVAFVAGGDILFDPDKQAIFVTVGTNRAYFLGVTGRFALEPVFFARAAPEMGFAGFNG